VAILAAVRRTAASVNAPAPAIHQPAATGDSTTQQFKSWFRGAVQTAGEAVGPALEMAGEAVGTAVETVGTAVEAVRGAHRSP